MILDTHNLYRNQIAGGQIRGYCQASRMATMVSNADNEEEKSENENIKLNIHATHSNGVMN